MLFNIVSHPFTFYTWLFSFFNSLFLLPNVVQFFELLVVVGNSFTPLLMVCQSIALWNGCAATCVLALYLLCVTCKFLWCIMILIYWRTWMHKIFICSRTQTELPYPFHLQFCLVIRIIFAWCNLHSTSSQNLLNSFGRPGHCLML